MKRLGLFLLFALAVSVPCDAQSVASLQGRVTDQSGAHVPHAHVKITLTATGAMREDDTNDSGDFQFQQLMPGTYSVRVEAPGFAPVLRENVPLQVATHFVEHHSLSRSTNGSPTSCAAPMT